MCSQCQKLIEIFIIVASLACRSNAKRNFPAFIASDRARNSSRGGSSTPSSLYANERVYSSDLDTAFEWLATDRVENEPSRYEGIKWFDPSAPPPPLTDEDISDVQLELVKMPLYPLGAVHLPHSGENYTIINIAPKNVKMAIDLVDGKWDNSYFCATVRARDTNRVASVGTVLQLLDTEDRSISGARTWPGNVLPTLNRVVANCKAVGVVDIVSIEDRDYEQDDYMIANVQLHRLPAESTDMEDRKVANEIDNFDGLAQTVIEDYQKVRSIYINSQSISQNELPKFARKSVETLPTFDTNDVNDETRFWKVVETWQMLCNTIRQSKQTQLNDMVNEISVTVAMTFKNGGPLELPVKRKSLPSDVQRSLEEMEKNASKDFMELGMEPVLEFQEILSMKHHSDRVQKLSWMIKRERSRLEAKESLINAFLGEELGEDWQTINLDDGQIDLFDRFS